MISWCNENQGFVSALLALSSVFVAIIALFISIKTSKKQNKIQIDLQARQLKLDTFQLRYECWESFETLYQVMLNIFNICKDSEENKKQALIRVYKVFINYNYNHADLKKTINKSKFIISKYREPTLNSLLYSLNEFCNEIKRIQNLAKNPHEYDEDNSYFFNEKYRIIRGGAFSIQLVLHDIMEKLENDLHMFDIIPNIEK